jgi:hypothetical protein
MYEDVGRPFAVGNRATWAVELVDGQSQGFPPEVLIDSSVVIGARPAFARSCVLASTPDLSAFWRGPEPVGSHLQIRAGLVADLFNPPFLTTVTGVIRRIQIAISKMASDERGGWNATGAWILTDVTDTRARLDAPPLDPAAEQQIGFLFLLELLSHAIEPFAPR